MPKSAIIRLNLKIEKCNKSKNLIIGGKFFMQKEEILNYVPKYYYCNRSHLWKRCNRKGQPLRNFTFKSKKYQLQGVGKGGKNYCNVEFELEVKENKVCCEIIWKQILGEQRTKEYGLYQYIPVLGDYGNGRIFQRQIHFYKEYALDKVMEFDEHDDSIIISIPLGKTIQEDFGWKIDNDITHVYCHECEFASSCDFFGNAYSTLEGRGQSEPQIVFPETAKINFIFNKKMIKRNELNPASESSLLKRKIIEQQRYIQVLEELLERR